MSDPEPANLMKRNFWPLRFAKTEAPTRKKSFLKRSFSIMFPKELEAFSQKQKQKEEARDSSERKIVFTADSLFC
jgi:hypothetical protein